MGTQGSLYTRFLETSTNTPGSLSKADCEPLIFSHLSASEEQRQESGTCFPQSWYPLKAPQHFNSGCNLLNIIWISERASSSGIESYKTFSIP
uniref:Uncharacterized protein n=1 Tax=Anguilla anguilla TaxID=7936 RepID=A0A0E9XXW6_ANGAN